VTGTPNDDQLYYYVVSLTRDLLPDDIDRVPDVPLLILLSDLKDMRFQIPNVLLGLDPLGGREIFVKNTSL